jgi:hypothetical protein
LIRVSSDRYRTLSLTSLGREVMAERVEEVALAPPVLRPSSPRHVRRRLGIGPLEHPDETSQTI